MRAKFGVGRFSSSFPRAFWLSAIITAGFVTITILDSILLEDMLVLTITRLAFGSAFLLFCVGYHLTTVLFPKSEIDNIERFVLSTVLSASLVLITGMILGSTSIGLSLLSMIATLSSLSVCFALINILQQGRKKIAHTGPPTDKLELLVIALLIFSSVVLPMRNVFEAEFFLAYDPFATAAFMNDITEGKHLSYTLPGKPLYDFYYPDFFGFFVLGAAVSVLLGISPSTIVRFGGPLMLAISVLCIFVLVRKMRLSRLFHILPPILFSTTSIVIYRFSMGIRENMVLANYILLALLLGEALKSTNKKGFVLRRVIAGSLLLGAAMNSHQSWLVIPAILILQLFLMILIRTPTKELKELFKLAVLFMALSLFFAIFSLPSIVDALQVYLTYGGAVSYGYIHQPLYFENFISYFSVPVLLLSLLGVVVFFGTETRKDRLLLFLFIWFLLALSLTQAAALGINMPGSRFAVLLSIPASIFSSLGLFHISQLDKRTLGISQCFFIEGKLVSPIPIRTVLSMLMIASIAIYSFFVASFVHGWVAWQATDVQAATWLRNRVLDHPGVVISVDFGLMHFSNISNYEPNMTKVYRILKIPSYAELLNFLEMNYGANFRLVYLLVSTATHYFINSVATSFISQLARMELLYENQETLVYTINLS